MRVRALAGKPHLGTFHSGVAVTDDGIALFHEWPAFKTWQGGEERLGLIEYDAEADVPRRCAARSPIAGSSSLRGLDGLFGLNLDDRTARDHRRRPAPARRPAAISPRSRSTPRTTGCRTSPRCRICAFWASRTRRPSDDGFAALARSRTLEHLWGRRCHNLRSRGFLRAVRDAALRGLSVSCLNVDDDALAALPRFPALRELMPMDMPDAGYRHIGRCARARVAGPDVLPRHDRRRDRAHHRRSSKLTYYFNSYTTITDRTPELLSTMDSLERITFDACHGLTDAGIAHAGAPAAAARAERRRTGRHRGDGQPFPPTVAVHRVP